MRKEQEIANQVNKDEHFDFITSLPPEVAFEVMKNLSIHQLDNLSKTNSYLREVGELVWKDKIFSFFDVFKETNFFQKEIKSHQQNNKTYKKIFFDLLKKISRGDIEYANLYIDIQENKIKDISSINFTKKNLLSPITLAILFNKELPNLSADILIKHLKQDIALLIEMDAQNALEKILQHSLFKASTLNLNNEFIKLPIINIKVSPVFYAAYLGKGKIIKLLTQNGAVINKTAQAKSVIRGSNIMHMAALNTSSDGIDAFKEIEKAYDEIYEENKNKPGNNLVETKRFVRAADKKRQTVLFYAAQQRNFKLMQHLIDKEKFAAFFLDDKGKHAFYRFLNSRENKLTVTTDEFINYFYSLNPSVADIEQLVKIFNSSKLGSTIPANILTIQQKLLQDAELNQPQLYQNLTLKEKFPERFLAYKLFIDNILAPFLINTGKYVAPTIFVASLIGLATIGALGIALAPQIALLMLFIPLFAAAGLFLGGKALAYLNKENQLSPFNLSIATYEKIKSAFSTINTGIKNFFSRTMSAVGKLFSRSNYQRLPTEKNDNSTDNILDRLRQQPYKEVKQEEKDEVEMQEEHFSHPFAKNVPEQKNDDLQQENSDEVKSAPKITKD